ncbi:hypothetical protein A6R68_19251 [Neotoma lepida]|uniref:Uncharacterized protein n=1 Tax=Neotoma lepida TaxID=56216 RepID=A0A1A6HL00_NEOLE|nr:hypothetical protein A6R68_19251 [Neotoma lepida]
MEYWEIQLQAGAEFLGKLGHSVQRGLREDTDRIGTVQWGPQNRVALECL